MLKNLLLITISYLLQKRKVPPRTEVHIFKRGDAVPPWVMRVTADDPEKPVQFIEFDMDVYVVRSHDGVAVMPIDPHGAGQAQIDIKGSNGSYSVDGAPTLLLNGDSAKPGRWFIPTPSECDTWESGGKE